MKKTSAVEQEVDGVRDMLCEKTLSMSPAERIAYFHELAVKAQKEYGVWQQTQAQNAQR